jgi:hypothetical protein
MPDCSCQRRPRGLRQSLRLESLRLENPRLESPRLESPRSESLRLESLRSESLRLESPLGRPCRRRRRMIFRQPLRCHPSRWYWSHHSRPQLRETDRRRWLA